MRLGVNLPGPFVLVPGGRRHSGRHALLWVTWPLWLPFLLVWWALQLGVFLVVVAVALVVAAVQLARYLHRTQTNKGDHPNE